MPSASSTLAIDQLLGELAVYCAPGASGVVTSGLPESQFHTSAPVSMSNARMTPDSSLVEKLSSTVPPTTISFFVTTTGEVEYAEPGCRLGMPAPRSIWPVPPPKRLQTAPLSGSSAITRPSDVARNSLASQSARVLPSLAAMSSARPDVAMDAAAGALAEAATAAAPLGGWYDTPRQVSCCNARPVTSFGS